MVSAASATVPVLSSRSRSMISCRRSVATSASWTEVVRPASAAQGAARYPASVYALISWPTLSSWWSTSQPPTQRVARVYACVAPWEKVPNHRPASAERRVARSSRTSRVSAASAARGSRPRARTVPCSPSDSASWLCHSAPQAMVSRSLDRVTRTTSGCNNPCSNTSAPASRPSFR
jgi:hypothetical protein